MDPLTQTKPKTSAKDFFLNLGAIVALFTVVVSLINLLFTAINKAYPQITTYSYQSSGSISFPVATLIIFFPIFVLLMCLLQRDYKTEPEKKHLGVRKWLTYITLFIAGLTLAGDLVTVLYYFLDGQELTSGFLLKVMVLFILIFGVFMYYLSDIRDKLTSMSRKIWLISATAIILVSIVWGFAVLGSPRTQQLIKYDEQKVTDLQNINYSVQNYFQMKKSLPSALSDVYSSVTYGNQPLDPQTKQPYEYVLIGQSAKAYQLCATFNRDSSTEETNTAYIAMVGVIGPHPAGHYCYNESIPVSEYPAVPVVPASPVK